MHRVNKSVIIVLVIFLILGIEVSLASSITIRHTTPDLLLITVIFFGLFYGLRIGLWVGLTTGLLRDIFDIGFFGTNILILGGVGVICAVLSDKVYKENSLTQFLITLIAAYLISRLSLSHALYTAFVAPFAIFMLHFFLDRVSY